MSAQELIYLTIQEAAARVRTRAVSPVELLDAVLARTSALEPQLNTYITPMFDQARAEARAAEQEIMAGQYRGPLHGIPIGLKDNYYTAGVRTTAGSKVLGDFVPRQDAFTVAKLRTAGAVITGKLNMDELGHGGTTDNPHYGPTRNPWKLDRSPGGSSGGSAAAVAAGMLYGATGADTGGSIRIPASYCGIVGPKPTYGRCSIAGIVPVAWSLDTAGPLTRSVADGAIMLQAMAGYDPNDETSADQPVPDFSAELGQGVAGLRLGLPGGDYFDLLDPEVTGAVQAAIGVLRGLGARVEEISLPTVADINSVRAFISRSEASAYNREWLSARPDDYGEDARTALEIGQFLLAGDYLRAQRLRSKLGREVRAAMQGFDAVLTPTVSTTALPFGADTVRIGNEEVPASAAIVRLTPVWNVSGVPTITVPCGFSSEGLPIGLQISTRSWDEARMFRIAEAYEQATPWHQRHPPL